MLCGISCAYQCENTNEGDNIHREQAAGTEQGRRPEASGDGKEGAMVWKHNFGTAGKGVRKKAIRALLDGLPDSTLHLRGEVLA